MLFLSYYKPEYSIILNKCLLNILIQNIIKQNISDLLKLSNNISDTIIHWNIIIPSNINKDDLGISINNMNHIDISYINKFEESYYKDDIIIYLDIEVYYSITYLQNLVLLLKNNNTFFCDKYYIYDIHTNNIFQYTI